MASEEKLNRALNETLAAHSLLCALGYLPRDLYFVVAPHEGCADRVHVGCLLRYLGKEFFTSAGVLDATVEETRAAWLKRCEWWNDPNVPQQQKNDVVDRTETRHRAVELIFALQQKGIR